MKKIMTVLTMMLLSVATGKAMTYEQARNEALFLTDKMAYELNLTDEQYEAAYEINLDYLMGVTSVDDVYGDYWERRNRDLNYVLLDWQWNAFCAATYFFRPLTWSDGFWHFGIYVRYPHRDFFYFGRPVFYATYRGGHAWHRHGAHGYYYGHRDHFRPAGRSHFGMLDRYNRHGGGHHGHSLGNRHHGGQSGHGGYGGHGSFGSHGNNGNHRFHGDFGRSSSTRTTVHNHGGHSGGGSFGNSHSGSFGGGRTQGYSGGGSFGGGRTQGHSGSQGGRSFGGGSGSHGGGSHGSHGGRSFGSHR